MKDKALVDTLVDVLKTNHEEQPDIIGKMAVRMVVWDVAKALDEHCNYNRFVFRDRVFGQAGSAGGGS